MANVRPLPRYRRTPATGGGDFAANPVSHKDQDEACRLDVQLSGLVLEDLDYEVLYDYMRSPNVIAVYAVPYNTPDGNAIKDAGGYSGYRSVKIIYGPDATYEEKAHKYHKTRNAEAGRYANYPFFPIGFAEAMDRQEEKGSTLLIVEGEKKAAAVQKYLGVPCIGIPGISNWRERSKSTDVKKELLEWSGKVTSVMILPDGDIERMDLNREVTMLLDGIKVVNSEACVLNIGPGNKIDDLIVDWLAVGGVELVRSSFTEIPVLDVHYWSHNKLIEKYQLAYITTGSIRKDGVDTR